MAKVKETTRLFFRTSHSHAIEGGGAVHYAAGHFYNVDDQDLAGALVRLEVAETEAQREQRLAYEAEQAAAAVMAADQGDAIAAAIGEGAAADKPADGQASE